VNPARASRAAPGPGAPRRLRVLAVTQQFPNAVDPLSSIFNRQQLGALSRRCDVDLLAPIPWFPGASLLSRWSTAGRLAPVPRSDRIGGLAVSHPRFLHLPGPGRALGAAAYAASLAAGLLRGRGRWDVLFSAWAFPDGAAAVLLARLLGLPAVVKVSGSDVNVLGALRGVALNLRLALPRASRVVAVSRPLAEAVERLGVPRDRIEVILNGVDGALFHPRDRAGARQALGAGGDGRRWIVFVGRLEESKGVLDLLSAFAALSGRRGDVRLVLVGTGRAAAACEARAAALGGRVLLAGGRPLEEIPAWMAAADLIALPSWAEGTPNAVLEALACGRRVVATAVGGIPDLISSPALGELVPPREPERLAAALERALDAPFDPEAVARLGARQGWDENAARLEGVLREAIA
jgi:glycosyltransferase involved in cell wall biosynthesis